MSTVMKITASGQISLPAETRRKWNTDRVVVTETIDGLLVRPFDPVALLRDEPAALEVEAMLLSGEQCLITAINLAEALDHIGRVLGIDVPQVQADVGELGLFVSSLDAELAAAAANLRRRHYHRTTRRVSLADCCAAAHALDRESQLATSDSDLLQLVLDEGGEVISLPNSFGVRFPAR
jgi:predicted nucleic acid-binding protein